MGLGKQAKVLTKGQIDAVLGYLSRTTDPIRNRVIFLLSIEAGLRAREIAALTWGMVCDSSGSVGSSIHLQNKASKGGSGRIIPLNRELRDCLIEHWYDCAPAAMSSFLIGTERSDRTSAQVVVNLFSRWYRALNLVGCSSHSGRRSFITNSARKISTVGGSLRDVQQLAGHSSLRTTQGYIEADIDSQRRIVDII